MDAKNQLAEFERDLRSLKSRFQEQRPYEQREIIFTLAEVARTLALSRMSIYRYRQMFPDLPKLPTFKASVRGWAERHGLPRKRGPLPGQNRKMAVAMREEGKTLSQVAMK